MALSLPIRILRWLLSHLKLLSKCPAFPSATQCWSTCHYYINNSASLPSHLLLCIVPIYGKLLIMTLSYRCWLMHWRPFIISYAYCPCLRKARRYQHHRQITTLRNAKTQFTIIRGNGEADFQFTPQEERETLRNINWSRNLLLNKRLRHCAWSLKECLQSYFVDLPRSSISFSVTERSLVLVLSRVDFFY